MGPSEPLVLCLAGWVEYPYSQTNYAAATAGVALQPPAIERLARRREVAGDRASRRLPGRPAATDDARPDRASSPARGASCGSRPTWSATTTRRSSPCATGRPRSRFASSRCRWRGPTWAIAATRARSRPTARQPLLYDYDHVDPAPLARLCGQADAVRRRCRSSCEPTTTSFAWSGPATRFGSSSMRRGCLRCRPAGREATSCAASAIARTQTRSRRASDTVEPLPWRGMPAYPFAREVTRPLDEAYQSYLRTYQTRPAGGDRSR